MKKNIWILAILLVLLIAGKTYPQYIREWVARCDTNAQAVAMALDSAGNIIVTSSYGGFLTIKYNAQGIEQWRRKCTGNSGSGAPTAIGVDKIGNIYVTGSDYDYILIKYSPNGNQEWIRTYSPPVPGLNYSNTIAIDGSNNTVITGGNWYGTGGRQFMTFKYEPNGDTLWARAYFQTAGNYGGMSQAIGIDKQENVYISGSSRISSSKYQFLTIKYDSNGNQKWVRSYQQPDSGNCSNVNSLQIDKNGNAIICGAVAESQTDFRYCTIKYDSLGNQIWVRKFKFLQNKITASSMKTDLSGNVYITGYGVYSATSGNNIITVKFDSLGNMNWFRNYGDTVNYYNHSVCNSINGLFVDNYGNSYITGFTDIGPYSSVIQSIKYNTNGVLQWAEQYAYNPDSNDYGGQDIKVNSDGDIFVFGTGFTYNNIWNLFLIKYSIVTNIYSSENNSPSDFKLFQNYPNPFNQSSIIKYQISIKSNVSLKVFDIIGREVAELVNEKKEPGIYETRFDGTNLASGVYFYSLFVDNKKLDTKTFILIK